MTLTVRRATFEEIAPLVMSGWKAELDMRDISALHWFALYDGVALVGFASAIIQGATGVFWNCFIVETHRRRGLYKRLYDARLRWFLSERKVTTLAAFCNSHSITFYLDRGFKLVALQPPSAKNRWVMRPLQTDDAQASRFLNEFF